MSDAAWALQTARGVGPISPPHAHAHPIHKLHTGPLHSTVAGRTDHLPSNVPNGAYVLPADIVSAMGEGNTMAGFKVAKRMFEGARRHFGGMPYSGDNGPYGQSGGPYGMAKGGSATGRQYPLAPRSEWYGDANYEQTGGQMTHMSPTEYLSHARPMDPHEETARDNINDLKSHIQSGKTLDPLALYPNGKEDGRHRAHAANELGIKSVPVLTWPKQPLAQGMADGGKAETPYEAGLRARLTQAKSYRDANSGAALSNYYPREQSEWLGGQTPTTKLKIYRAAKPDVPIRPGDYVTNSRQYAAQHLRDNLGGDGVIHSADAGLHELHPADGPKEFHYYPEDDSKFNVEPHTEGMADGGKVPEGWETLHRGEGPGTGSGNFWTHDREFARQFTRSGQDNQIKKRYIKSSDVHVPSPLPYAGDEGAHDSAVNEARGLGKSAVRMSEGAGEPPSTYVFNKSALKFMHPYADGGQASGEQGVPVAVAGGEHVLAPHEVAFAGMGNMDMGHRALDEFVLRQRAKTVKTLRGLPGPKRD